MEWIYFGAMITFGVMIGNAITDLVKWLARRSKPAQPTIEIMVVDVYVPATHKGQPDPSGDDGS